MKIYITAFIKIDFENPLETQVHVRKVELDDDDRVIAIYGLSKKDGSWIEIPEATEYPNDCYLPISVYNNFGYKD